MNLLKIKNNLNLNVFSLCYFYKFYIFLGNSKINTNYINNYYLIGFYNLISIINLYVSLSVIKLNFSYLIKLLLYKYSSVLLINEISNKYILNYLRSVFNVTYISYFFNNWWKGFLKNYKLFINHKSRLLKDYSFKFFQFPSFVFFLYQYSYNNNYSAEYVSNELSDLFIPNLIFLDVNYNFKNIYNVMPTNLKTLVPNLFFVKLLVLFIVKISFLKRKLFFFNIFFFNKWLNNFLKFNFYSYKKIFLNFLNFIKNN